MSTSVIELTGQIAAAMRQRRVGVRLGICLAAGVLLAGRANDASAAAFGGAATSLGLLAAVSVVVLMKAWQAHFVVAGLSTLGGLLALVTGLVLLWRTRPLRRWFAWSSPTGHRVGDRQPLAEQVKLPAEVDSQRLLADLRRTFIALQTAWDQGARDDLGRMTTPDMLEDLCAARSAGFGATHLSQVVTLEANLVAFEELNAAQLVCVEFSGLIRESLASSADPFRELWMLSRPKDASEGWRLARHQALL